MSHDDYLYDIFPYFWPLLGLYDFILRNTGKESKERLRFPYFK